MKHLDAYTTQRALSVGALVMTAVAFVGFFVGTEDTYEGRGYSYVPPPQNGDAPVVLSYQERMTTPRHVNSHFAASFSTLAISPEALGDATDPALRAQAREARQSGRAYEGAPPTVPHPMDQSGAPGCLSCHGSGANITGVVAPKISHERYTNCTQCHVERDARRPFAETNPEDLPLDSSFRGFHLLGDGDRVWDDAPPQTPHTTLMRENCASCHGAFGPAGLRTTHPERQNCLQCHGVSSEFDQRPERLERNVF